MILAGSGIFVGERELEVDLLPAAADQIKKTYAQLRTGRTARERFNNAVDSVAAGRAKEAKRLLAHINRVGKCRFAQRLAPKLKDVEAPKYIASAIETVIRLVR